MSLPREYLLAIKAEIANDPLALGYLGKTDQQQADILNAPAGVTTFMAIPAKSMFDSLPFARIQAIWDSADSPSAVPVPNTAGRQAAIAFRAYMLAGQSINVNTGTPGGSVISALVTAGLLTVADVTAAVTTAQQLPPKRRQQIGLSGVLVDLVGSDITTAKATV